jgi:hypothetical protein
MELLDPMTRRHLVAASAALLLLSSIAGCSGPPWGTPVPSGPTPAPFVLSVDDRSSWGTLQVLMVAPGDPGVPPLPWTVRLVAAGGQTVDQRTEDGAAGPRWLLVWDAQVDEGGGPALGPAPACAMPSPSIAPLPTAGLTSAAAIEAGAKLLAGRALGDVAVQTATIGRLGNYATVAGADPQAFVWALTYSGAFADPSTCVASPPSTPCPSQGSALVILNFETGAELSVAVPAPQR